MNFYKNQLFQFYIEGDTFYSNILASENDSVLWYLTNNFNGLTILTNQYKL
jgi:hypothetical protein